MKLCFVDCETTGLDADRHTIIEVACVKGDESRVWWMKLHPEEVSVAEAGALKINHYYDRDDRVSHEITTTTHVRVVDRAAQARLEAAIQIVKFTKGCVLAGNNVKFDQLFLEKWIRKHGACPLWDYHVVDVPTFVAGYLTKELETGTLRLPDLDLGDNREEDEAFLSDLLQPPFKGSNASEALGIEEPKDEDKHTALGDALWSKCMWQAISDPKPSPV